MKKIRRKMAIGFVLVHLNGNYQSGYWREKLFYEKRTFESVLAPLERQQSADKYFKYTHFSEADASVTLMN